MDRILRIWRQYDINHTAVIIVPTMQAPMAWVVRAQASIFQAGELVSARVYSGTVPMPNVGYAFIQKPAEEGTKGNEAACCDSETSFNNRPDGDLVGGIFSHINHSSYSIKMALEREPGDLLSETYVGNQSPHRSAGMEVEL